MTILLKLSKVEKGRKTGKTHWFCKPTFINISLLHWLILPSFMVLDSLSEVSFSLAILLAKASFSFLNPEKLPFRWPSDCISSLRARIGSSPGPIPSRVKPITSTSVSAPLLPGTQYRRSTDGYGCNSDPGCQLRKLLTRMESMNLCTWPKQAKNAIKPSQKCLKN